MADDTPQLEPAPRFDATDGIAFAGLLLLSLGAAMVYLPLGLIVPGIVLLAVALLQMVRR